MTFEEISHSASRRSDKASERTYKNALEKGFAMQERQKYS